MLKTNIAEQNPTETGRPQLLDLLGSFATVTTDERNVVLDEFGRHGITETVRLDSPEGQSVGVIKWEMRDGPLVGRYHKIKDLSRPASGSYLYGFDIKKYFLEETIKNDFGSVAGMLGYKYGSYPDPDSRARAKVWIFPSPERISHSAQQDFERLPEHGYPLLATVAGQEASNGILKTRDFFDEVIAGRLPISPESDSDRHLHDLIVHISYNVLPSDFFRHFQDLAKHERSLDHNWDKLPQGNSAAILMQSFDFLTARLSTFLQDYRQNGSNHHATVRTAYAKFLSKTSDLKPEDVFELANHFTDSTLKEVTKMTKIASAK